MIIYTCPKCGGDLEHLVYTTYPPVYEWHCQKCGWKYEDRDKIKRIPFDLAQPLENEVWNG